MLISAKLNYLRIAPRKVRLAADLIRGKKVPEALVLLKFSSKKATRALRKLLEQAVANAKNNFKLGENNLYIHRIQVDEGPKLKRWRARSRGQAFEIQKKTSHIKLILEEIEKSKKKIKRKKKTKEKIGEKVEELESLKKEQKIIKKDQLKKRKKPESYLELQKPKTKKGIRRVFRRKAF